MASVLIERRIWGSVWWVIVPMMGCWGLNVRFKFVVSLALQNVDTTKRFERLGRENATERGERRGC